MKKVMLIILDGYGLNASEKGNAVLAARKPNIDKLMNDFPCAELVAHGEEVGLPKGQMGNSEVGHMTIGSGRSIKQPLLLINDKIKIAQEKYKDDENWQISLNSKVLLERYEKNGYLTFHD